MFLCEVVHKYFKSPFKPNIKPWHGCLQEILPWCPKGSSKFVFSLFKIGLAVLLRRKSRNNQLLHDTFFK